MRNLKNMKTTKKYQPPVRRRSNNSDNKEKIGTTRISRPVQKYLQLKETAEESTSGAKKLTTTLTF